MPFPSTSTSATLSAHHAVREEPDRVGDHLDVSATHYSDTIVSFAADGVPDARLADVRRALAPVDPDAVLDLGEGWHGVTHCRWLQNAVLRPSSGRL